MKAIDSILLLLLLVGGCGHTHERTPIPGMHGAEAEILYTSRLKTSTTIRTLDTLDGYDFERIDHLLKALGGFDPERCERWLEDEEFFDGDRNIDCYGTISDRRCEVRMIMHKRQPASASIEIDLSFKRGDPSQSAFAESLADNLARTMSSLPSPGSIDSATRMKFPDCFQGDSALFAPNQWTLLTSRAFAPGNRMLFDEEGRVIIIDGASPELRGNVAIMFMDCQVTRAMND